MQYDAADRMIQRVDPDLASVWIYDAPAGVATTNCAATYSCGKLTESYTAPLGSNGSPNHAAATVDTTHTYDNMSRPLQSVKTLDNATGNVFTTTLTYDPWGRLITTAHQRGNDAVKQFGQRYNGFGYLSLVEREFGNSAQILWQSTAQDASNRVIQAKLGNGLYGNRTYDAGSGFLAQGVIAKTALGWDATPSALALSEDYAYDKLGNVSSRTEQWNTGITGGLVTTTGFSESFFYDGLNRLSTSTVVGGATQAFTYDVTGNITSKTGVGSGNYVYPSGANSIRPHAVQSIPGIGSFSYDADGNQLTGNGRTTTWTTFDMPLSITRNNNSIVNSSVFTYGPDYERTTQQENNAGTQSTIFYGGAQEVQLDVNKNVKSVKTYWPNGLGVEIDRPTQTTELDWTHEDRLGSIVAITDANGNLKEAMGFDAWGSRRQPGGTVGVTPSTTQVTETTDDKGFTGQEMLDPLELVHLNGRVYDPLVGKFVSADPHITDPLNGQNYNRYSYVLNNPTNLTDPTGFDVVQEVEVTGHWVAHETTTVCKGRGCAAFLNRVRQSIQNREAAAIHRESARTLRETADTETSPWEREAAGELYEEADREDKLADLLDGEIKLDANFVIEVVGSLAAKKFAGIGLVRLRGNAAAAFLSKSSKQYGSYTNTHASGKTYHGKGSQARSQQSGREKAIKYNDPHVATDWSPSADNKGSLKDEALRLRGDDNGGPRGHDNPNNYNQRASPGEKLLQQDGQ
jgi:RHS repeat-associated protein